MACQPTASGTCTVELLSMHDPAFLGPYLFLPRERPSRRAGTYVRLPILLTRDGAWFGVEREGTGRVQFLGSLIRFGFLKETKHVKTDEEICRTC